ncbi:hypothetical protein [Leptospira vanthielii]|uniref:Uncharacterized protein n=1 Tax=Leptospira vanthielii serovar Holland str. Waz Holland = ATCC 700522 TaxID=1218591 RepID=N1VVH5_9LEPT|nr:hypothetical protein [Leptospira vanthielii]EMY67974.1 hypothetical protein LEP1GSC199_3923 [Leptospira vanthielii serovar Holland str. Waz Holland = ATCC 700522]
MSHDCKPKNGSDYIQLLSIYINLMQQNELKSISVTGFYVALLSAILASDNYKKAEISLNIFLFFIGILATYINYSFRGWKKDYLKYAKSIVQLILVEFPNLDECKNIPIALRKKFTPTEALYPIDALFFIIPLFGSLYFFSYTVVIILKGLSLSVK